MVRPEQSHRDGPVAPHRYMSPSWLSAKSIAAWAPRRELWLPPLPVSCRLGFDGLDGLDGSDGLCCFGDFLWWFFFASSRASCSARARSAASLRRSAASLRRSAA